MIRTRKIFATKDDLALGLKYAEKRLRLKYVQCTGYDSPDIKIFHSALDIPEFGTEQAENILFARSFLVLPDDEDFDVYMKTDFEGNVSYAINCADEKRAIRFNPGGLVNSQDILAGVIMSLHSIDSNNIFRSFARYVTGNFENIYGWWVGPEALKVMQQGGRLLTRSLDQDTIYDLRR